jgi:uncharacterized protein YdeI (YjbR/CyaY-like superfamily)
MPPTKDPRIDAYIGRAAPFAQPILTRLRKLVHAGCPDIEETIKWSHATFVYRGKIFAGMAAFKEHATFGFWHQGMEKVLAADGFKAGDAMGLMGRIGTLADLPDDKTMLRYIKAATALHDSGAPSRPAPKPKPAMKTPADLAAALRKNKRAAAEWDDFSPSARREYISWITEAKRKETRAARVATTLEWVASGKPRNWKYMNC